MKVLKNNYKPLESKFDYTPNYPIKHVCQYCKSEFEYDKDDIKYRPEWKPFGNEYEPAYDYIICPCCNREIALKTYN